MSYEVKLTGVEFEVEKNDSIAVLRIKENENVFVKTAKEVADLDKKVLQQVADFSNAYAKAAVELSVEKAGEVFKEDDSIEKVEVILPYGINKSDKIETLIVKEKEYHNPMNGETFKAPAIKVAIESKVSKISKSFIKKLKDELAETLA